MNVSTILRYRRQVLMSGSLLIVLICATAFLPDRKNNIEMESNEELLRHVVLFSFKPETSSEDIKKIEEAFVMLQDKIPQIHDFEWGTNNSPEGLDDGFTHCFLLTFLSEDDRAIYLPHPDHKAFGAILSPHLEKVTVVDYWAQ